ncbi:hypothetical protein CAPTEDRAFT_139493, partial [Capitella teleta]
TLMDILPKRSLDQRLKIREDYQAKYKKDLKDDIGRKLNSHPGPLKHAMTSLVMSQGENDAHTVRQAVKGFGTNEADLNEILITKNKQELNTMQAAYDKDYDESVEDAIKGDTSGGYQKVCLDLLKGDRDQGSKVDNDQAKRDAQNIHQSNESNNNNSNNTDGKPIKLARSSDTRQCFSTLSEYKQHSSLGVMCNPIVVKYLDSPSSFFAEKLNQSVTGSLHDKDLTRVVVSRHETDLNIIKSEYERINGHTIGADVKGKCKGDHKAVMLTLLNEP